jgi:MoaA/NifB/PqqE/SkfB family radical SAM enzyme
LFSKSTFCALPWSSIQINPSGNFKICCFSGNDGNHGVGKDENGDVMNIMTHSIEDALNSDLHKQLRLAQSRNERHPVCDVCWRREDANYREIADGAKINPKKQNISHRITRTFFHLADQKDAITTEQASSRMAPDGSIDSFPVLLDIRFSNLCNAKCIQCEPQYSTLWYNDHMELTGSDTFNVGPKEYKIIKQNNKLTTNMVRWHDTPEWWNQFERIKHKLKHIYITGGEPFVQPSHDEMLDRLIASNLAEDIIIEYDTNLTVINEKILNRLSKFKKIRFSVSVDDIEKRYELIRYPSSWKRLLENLKMVKTVVPTEDIRISMCVGIFDVYAPIRVVPFFSNLGHTTFPIRLLRSPSCYDLAYLPKEVQLHILEEYSKSDLDNRYKMTTVGYIKNNLDTHVLETRLSVINSFKQRMDTLDRLRGTDWKETFPEVADMLAPYKTPYLRK